MLSIVFGFEDSTILFNLRVYLANLVKFFILSFIALLIHNWVQKFYADRVGAVTDFSLWSSITKIRLFGKQKIFKFPTGIVAPLLVTFISLGQVFFAAATTTETRVKPAYRIGRKFVKLTEYERAKIAVISPIAHILIAIILNLLAIPVLDDFARVNTMIAISTMLPLPGLLGITVFFGSKPLYVISAVFILVSALLTNFLSPFATIIVAVILALAAFFTYLYRFHK